MVPLVCPALKAAAALLENTLSLFSELETPVCPGLHRLVSDVTTLKVTFGLKDLIRDAGLQAETRLQW